MNYNSRNKITSDLLTYYFRSENTFILTSQKYQNILDLLDFQGNINLIFYVIFSVVFYNLNKVFFTIDLANDIFTFHREKKKVKESKDASLQEMEKTYVDDKKAFLEVENTNTQE